MSQLDTIEAIEKRLWTAADTLRSNSNYASNEYFMPVMGLIFLRHAYSRFLAVKGEIEANLRKRGGKTRALTKEDFSQKGAIYLRPEAQFDYLVSLTDSDNRAQKLIDAMVSIEADYQSLKGSLPKAEYQDLGKEVKRGMGVSLRYFSETLYSLENSFEWKLPRGMEIKQKSSALYSLENSLSAGSSRSLGRHDRGF
jgi:type I restriction-modification system DNA methylase subunit